MLKFRIHKKENIEKKVESEVEELREYFSSRGLIEKPSKPLTPPEYVLEQYPTRILGSLLKIREVGFWKNYWKGVVNAIFGEVWKISPGYFTPVRDAVDASGMKLLPDTYVSLMSAGSFLAAVVTFISMIFVTTIFKWPLWEAFLGIIGLPILVLIGVFALFYVLPFQQLNKKRISIETNLPFAINHMAAVASSGVPPEKAFEMLVEYREYGAVSDEAEAIVKRVNVLGEDLTVAIRAIAAKTPSVAFKELLYGILAITEGGGNLKDYLREMASVALFNYKLARARYLEALTTYADIYTAILIAAPLFLISTLAVMGIVPGAAFAGMTINQLMMLSTYIGIPLVNIIFLVFLSVTQPTM